jgi:hypothetical protein
MCDMGCIDELGFLVVLSQPAFHLKVCPFQEKLRFFQICDIGEQLCAREATFLKFCIRIGNYWFQGAGRREPKLLGNKFFNFIRKTAVLKYG